MSKSLLIANLLTLATISCYAHKDDAYMHSVDDGFNDRSNWMKDICDDVELRELALPGTHDSGTFTLNNNLVRQTQVLDFNQQLKYGIRVFDIRIKHTDDKFKLYHAETPLNLDFEDFLETINDFLERYYSETILFRLKKELDDDNNNTRSMKSTLKFYLAKYRKNFLRTSDKSISLKHTRGKFIILSNNSEFHSLGLKYETMNTQDFFHLQSNSDLYKKWEAVKRQLDNARNGYPDWFYVNYLSAAVGSYPYFVSSGHSSPETDAPRLSTGFKTPEHDNLYPDFPRVNCIDKVCTIVYEGTNILTRNKIRFYNENNIDKERTVGIIFADFPGDSLINEIILNNRLLAKESKRCC